MCLFFALWFLYKTVSFLVVEVFFTIQHLSFQITTRACKHTPCNHFPYNPPQIPTQNRIHPFTIHYADQIHSRRCPPLRRNPGCRRRHHHRHHHHQNRHQDHHHHHTPLPLPGKSNRPWSPCPHPQPANASPPTTVIKDRLGAQLLHQLSNPPKRMDLSRKCPPHRRPIQRPGRPRHRLQPLHHHGPVVFCTSICREELYLVCHQGRG